jgi:hypothetical protein
MEILGFLCLVGAIVVFVYALGRSNSHELNDESQEEQDALQAIADEPEPAKKRGPGRPRKSAV